jgi:hypothetical protein
MDEAIVKMRHLWFAKAVALGIPDEEIVRLAKQGTLENRLAELEAE